MPVLGANLNNQNLNLKCDHCGLEWEEPVEDVKDALDEAIILWGANPQDEKVWYMFCYSCYREELERIWPSSQVLN